jgi:hypothetical protein
VAYDNVVIVEMAGLTGRSDSAREGFGVFQ